MKRFLLLLIASFSLATGSLSAQDVQGTWQGTLSVGAHDLRTVLKISKAADSILKGTFYSIDQGAEGLPTGPIQLSGGVVKFAVPGIGGDYTGKLSADGKTLTGSWSQGGKALPLNLAHVTPETAWAMPAQREVLKPMPPDADPTFDVATIKPAKPDEQGSGIIVDGRHFRTMNQTLDDLIAFAYGLHPKQILGGPAWIATEKFDIDAQPDIVGAPNDRQIKSMIRKLLKERFQLTTHTDTKELSAYALTLAKGGPKLTKSEGDPEGLPGLFFQGLGKLAVRNATMGDFTQLMQSVVLDRPVVDQTGLKGRWDFTLNWTPDESQFGGLSAKIPPPSDKADAPPTLFTAIQEQLGMKLTPTRSNVQVLSIDKVEQPSAN